MNFVESGLGAGILGLAFEDHQLSAINAAVQDKLQDPNSTLGATPIFNILISNPSLPNSFDVALDRTSDLNDTAIGTLTIGAHAAGYEGVTEQPQLPRVFQGRWTVPSDGMQVNGKPFQFGPSSVDGLQPGQFATLLDTGFSFPPLPRRCTRLFSLILGMATRAGLNKNNSGTCSLPYCDARRGPTHM